MALRGHLWTLLPLVRSSLRGRERLLGDSWSGTVADVVVGDVELSGALHVPSGARDLVLLVHGMGGNAESDYLRVGAGAATRAGFASLRLSLRGADLRGEDYHHAGLTDDLVAATLIADSAAGLVLFCRLGRRPRHIRINWAILARVHSDGL